MIKEIKKKEWEDLLRKDLSIKFNNKEEQLEFIIQSILKDLENLGILNGDNGDSKFYVQSIMYKTNGNSLLLKYIGTNTKFEFWLKKMFMLSKHYTNDFVFNKDMDIIYKKFLIKTSFFTKEDNNERSEEKQKIKETKEKNRSRKE